MIFGEDEKEDERRDQGERKDREIIEGEGAGWMILPWDGERVDGEGEKCGRQRGKKCERKRRDQGRR